MAPRSQCENATRRSVATTPPTGLPPAELRAPNVGTRAGQQFEAYPGKLGNDPCYAEIRSLAEQAIADPTHRNTGVSIDEDLGYTVAVIQEEFEPVDTVVLAVHTAGYLDGCPGG